MPGRAKCEAGCACEKHSRARMSPDQERESRRKAARRHYERNREATLSTAREKRRDPVSGGAIRAQQRSRSAAMSPAERERKAQLHRDWYRRNPRSPAENTKAHLQHRYGLTPERHAEMLARQAGLCYLCGEPLPDDQRKTHVDHDHTCCRGKRSCGTCIRGLACEGCNTGVGMFGDDPERMRRVADNLEMANLALRAGRSLPMQLPFETEPEPRQ